MKNHAITAAAIACALLTVLGERAWRLIAFAWHCATTKPAPEAAPAESPPQPAPAAPVAPAIVQPLAAAAAPRPGAVAAPPLSGLTVLQLRTLARARLGPGARPGGRRIASATRAALLEALVG